MASKWEPIIDDALEQMEGDFTARDIKSEIARRSLVEKHMGQSGALALSGVNPYLSDYTERHNIRKIGKDGNANLYRQADEPNESPDDVKVDYEDEPNDSPKELNDNVEKLNGSTEKMNDDESSTSEPCVGDDNVTDHSTKNDSNDGSAQTTNKLYLYSDKSQIKKIYRLEIGTKTLLAMTFIALSIGLSVVLILTT